MNAGGFPRDRHGFPAANYLLAEDADRPCFAGPTQFSADDEPAIVIIGAGFTGLSAALELAELRSSGTKTRILLLERDRVASGPSGKSAGHICGLQAPDDAVRRRCGEAAGGRLIDAAADAQRLVRSLIDRLEIPGDVRDGYVLIDAAGRQSLTEHGREFGIAPYPFALGLAHAAATRGVEIHEGVTVTGLRPTGQGVLVSTTAGVIRASHVLACGGHRMAETIPLLAPLRRRTTELRVSTIITDPLPNSVLRDALPAAGGERFPFADSSADVAYGSIDRANRLVFGAHATASGHVAPEKIMSTLDRLLPRLWPAYREATGQDLPWRPLVVAEPLCFTRDFLPNVGALGVGILYVQALGGHGIALGTLLGKAAAGKILGDAALFDAFAAVPHGWLPAWQPWRQIAARLGLLARSHPLRWPSHGVPTTPGPNR